MNGLLKQGVIVRNRYYTDDGMEYVYDRLIACFRAHGVHVDVCSPTLSVCSEPQPVVSADFAVFWDKDVALARAIEQGGVRCFNASRAIAVCDDKLSTYLALQGRGLRLIDTVAAPLMYPANDEADEAFLAQVSALGFPLIVKERVGSRGAQVHLVENESELRACCARLRHTPYICQRFIRESAGCDVRVYVIGGEAMYALTRTGDGFLSNAAAGSKAQTVDVTPWRESAETVAKALHLDYAAVDFLLDGSLVEVNSNAYFTAAERLGADIAGAYARHVVRSVYGS